MQMNEAKTQEGRYKNWKYWRESSKNLYWFCSVVLARMYPDKFQDWGALQMQMCDFLDLRKTPSRRKFLSAFRGSSKTTALLGYVVWQFCWYVATGRSTSMIYNTATKENCWNFNNDVRYCLLWSENPLLHYIFPELPRTEEAYTMFTKNKVRFKHVNIDFASLEETLVSRHHPIWINDDLENDRNVKYRTSRQALKDSWYYQKAILTKSKKKGIGLEIDTGTPFHFDGLIWSIRNLKTYDNLEIPCYTYNGKPCFEYRDGVKSAWEEFYSIEDFEEKRGDMPAQIFSSQYLLRPMSEMATLCKPEWASNRWSFEKGLPENTWRTCVYDAGGMNPQTDDATGITIVDTDEKGDMYEVHTEEFWGTSVELLNKIVQIDETYKPDDTRIEKDKYAITIADLIQHKFPLFNISFVEHEKRPKGYKHGEIVWQGRIWRLQPWFEKGRFFFHPTNRLLSSRVQTYPFGKRDDIEDSLAYHLDIRRTPPPLKKPRFTPNIEKSFDEEYDKYVRGIRSEEDHKYYDRIY